MVQKTKGAIAFSKSLAKMKAKKFSGSGTKADPYKKKEKPKSNKKFVQQVRNPADVKAGIKAEDQPVTGPKAEPVQQKQQPQPQPQSQLTKTPFQKIQEGQVFKQETTSKGTLVETLPGGYERRVIEERKPFRTKPNIPQGFAFVTEEKEVDIKTKQLKGGGFSLKGTKEPIVFAEAKKKSTGEKFAVVGESFIPKDQFKSIKGIQVEKSLQKVQSDFIPIPRTPGGLLEPAQEQQPLASRLQRKLQGLLTEKATRGRLVYPEELGAELKTKLPILGFQQIKPFDSTLTDKEFQAQQRRIFMEQEAVTGDALSFGAKPRIINFAQQSKFDAFQAGGNVLQDPSLKTTGKLITSAGKAAVGQLGQAFVQAPVITSASLYAATQLPTTLVTGLFAGQATKEIIEEPTPGGKLALGGIAAVEVGAFVVGGKVVRSINRAIGVEKIRVPFNEQINILKTKPLQAKGEFFLKPKKLIEVTPTFKEVKIKTIKERTFLEENIDPFSKKKRITEVTERIPIEEVKFIEGPSFTIKAVRQLQKPFTRPIDIKTFGLQAGTRGLVLGTKVPKEFGGLSFGLPKKGRRITVDDVVGVATQPVGAVAAKSRFSIFDAPGEIARQRSAIEVGRILFPEKGLPVSSKDIASAEPIISGLSKTESRQFFQLAETFASKGGRRLRLPGQKKGEFFGTFTTLQSPKKFQKEIFGDVDVKIPLGRTRAESATKRFSEKLTKEGFGVEIPKGEPLSINLKRTGEKIFEVKSKDVIAGEETVAGFAGFRFGVRRPVKFGKAKGRQSGEQFVTKISASSFIRPATKIQEVPEPFRVAGLFPKEKRFKDLPDMIARGQGLIEIRETIPKIRQAPVSRALRMKRTQKAKEKLQDFIESFSEEQQLALRESVKESTIGGVRIKLQKGVGVRERLPSLSLKGSKGGIPIFKTPSTKEKKKEKSISGYKSVTIKSLKTPLAKSLLQSKIPSATQKSLAGSPVTSLRSSPTISKITSLRSPSVRSLKSPKSPTSLITTTTIPKTPGPFLFLFPPGQTRKKKSDKSFDRLLKYTPSLVALEGKLKGKQPGILTGLEIRRITT